MIKNSKILFLFGIFLILTSNICADFSNKDFQNANESYKNGNFEESIKLYKKIIFDGYYSSELFYNLSNAYYRLGKIGQSLVYIEKAYKLTPRDSDIRYNRNILLIRTGDKDSLLYKCISFFSINEIFFINLSLYILFFINLFVWYYYKENWFYWFKFIIMNLLILFLILGFISYKEIFSRKYGVVITSYANIYSEPKENSTIGFTASNGKKLEILNKNDSWYEVGEKTKALKGWIKKEDVEVI